MKGHIKIMSKDEKIIKFESTLVEMYYTSEITTMIKEYIEDKDITYLPSPVIQNNINNIFPIKYRGFTIGYIRINDDNMIKHIELTSSPYTDSYISDMDKINKELQNFKGYKISFDN